MSSSQSGTKDVHLKPPLRTTRVTVPHSAARDPTKPPNTLRQKQVDDAIKRGFKRLPPRGKCRAVFTQDNSYVGFFHYHHPLLVYDRQYGKVITSWAEKPTDFRILHAALANLNEEFHLGNRTRV